MLGYSAGKRYANRQTSVIVSSRRFRTEAGGQTPVLCFEAAYSGTSSRRRCAGVERPGHRPLLPLSFLCDCWHNSCTPNALTLRNPMDPNSLSKDGNSVLSVYKAKSHQQTSSRLGLAGEHPATDFYGFLRSASESPAIPFRTITLHESRQHTLRCRTEKNRSRKSDTNWIDFSGPSMALGGTLKTCKSFGRFEFTKRRFLARFKSSKSPPTPLKRRN